MLVLMSCLLMVAAPITAVGGMVMALQQDLGLSAILLVSIPVLLVSMGLVLSRMVPQFRAMQERIDGVNQVLREQIIGHPGGAGLRPGARTRPSASPGPTTCSPTRRSGPDG